MTQLLLPPGVDVVGPSVRRLSSPDPIPVTSQLQANGGVKVPTGAGTGLVWTSDVAGVGSWQALPASGSAEPTFSIWKTIQAVRYFQIDSAATAQTWTMYATGQGGSAASRVGDANTGVAAFWFDPADYTAGARTTNVRVRAELLTNAVAPTVNYTFGLYPVATWGGASGAWPTIATIGAAVCTVAINTPGATTHQHAETAATAAPSAGWYVFIVATNATKAANAIEVMFATLQYQQV